MLDEAFRVSDICGIKDGLRLSEDDGRLAMMQGRGGQEADAGVVVHLVVSVGEVNGSGAR